MTHSEHIAIDNKVTACRIMVTIVTEPASARSYTMGSSYVRAG